MVAVHVDVISLDRTPERYSEFLSHNGHLSDFSRFSAIDGNTLDKDALVRERLVEPNIFPLYRPGALGCAISHLALWKQAEAGPAMTICEDDAIFNRHFEAEAQGVINSLPPDWHLILWGWNFSPYVAFQIIPGAFRCVLQSSDTEVRCSFQEYRSQQFTPRPYRLIETFGLVCYSLSPHGARALRQMCLPLHDMQIHLVAQSRWVPNFAIDTLLNAFYAKLNAYVCFPPLVVTRNDNETSTASKFD